MGRLLVWDTLEGCSPPGSGSSRVDDPGPRLRLSPVLLMMTCCYPKRLLLGYVSPIWTDIGVYDNDSGDENKDMLVIPCV